MSKESNFLIYCMERYRHFKGLSGAMWRKPLKSMGYMGISQNILNHCTQWGIIASCRILTIILAASQAINGSRRNCLYDIPPKGGIYHVEEIF